MTITSTEAQVVPSPLKPCPGLVGQDSEPKPASEYLVFLRPLYAVPCHTCSERLRACVKAIDPQEKRCQGCQRGRNNCTKASRKHRKLSGLWAWIDRRNYRLSIEPQELQRLERDIEPSSLAQARDLAVDQIKMLQVPTAAQVRSEQSTSSRIRFLEDRLKKLPLIEIPEEEDDQDGDYRPEADNDQTTETETETSSATWNSSESDRTCEELTAEPSSGTSEEDSSEESSEVPSNSRRSKPIIATAGSTYHSIAASEGSPTPWTPWMEARYLTEHPQPGFRDVIVMSRAQLENNIGNVVLNLLQTAAAGGVAAVNVREVHAQVKDMLDVHSAKIVQALDVHLAKILPAGGGNQDSSED